MPLSEHEQRQLEQIEQALYSDHPRLAKVMRARDPRVHYGRRVREASLGFLVGAAALVAGLFLKYGWLSAVGLVVMLLSLVWAVASIRRRASMVAAERKRSRSRRRGRAARPPANSGLMERLEERWRKRQEGNNR